MDEEEFLKVRQEANDFHLRMIAETDEDRRSIVPIYRGIHPDGFEHNRSGVLFSIGQRHFILTAAHYLRDYLEANQPLFTSPSTQGAAQICLEGDLWADEKIDIAAISIPDHVYEQLVPARRFLNITDLDLCTDTPDAFYVVRGYPCQLSTSDNEIRRITNEPYNYGAFPYKGTPWTDSAYDPSHTMAFRHETATTYPDGSRVVAVDLPGMSGGAIFRLNNYAVGNARTWQPTERKLVAIQKSYAKGSFFLGSRIVVALRGIAREFPDCRRPLELTF